MKTLFDRVNSPTPPWWKKVRNVATVVAAVSGAVLAAPIVLPAGVAAVLATVLTVATTVAGAAQCTVDGNAKQ